MATVEAIYNVQKVLVGRVDRKSTILEILYYNEQFISRDEKIIGQTFESIGLEPKICEQCAAHLKLVFATLVQEVFELHIGNRYYKISYLPEGNNKEQLKTILIIVEDISQEQNLKEELIISKGKLQLAQQIAMLGYFDRDVVNNRLYWSDEIYKNFGLIPQEKPASIELLLSFIHPEDVKMIRHKIMQKPVEESFDLEYRIIKKDGSIGWIHSLVQTILDEQGEVLRAFGIFQNITKRKTAEIELKVLTEELQKINDSLIARGMATRMAEKIAKMGYFEWDQTKEEMYWSEQQYRNFDYTSQAVRSTVENLRSRVHPEDYRIVQNALTEVQDKTYLDFQFRVIKQTGQLGWLYCRMNVMKNKEGNHVKIFGITQDITEQKQAEERIRRVEKELAFTNQLDSRSTYLNKLLFNTYPIEYITKAFHEMGINTQLAYCCFVLQLSEKLVNSVDITDTPLMLRKQAVLIWLAEKDWGVVWRCHETIVILTSVRDHAIGNKQSQIKFADTIIAEIEEKFPDLYIKVGISGTSLIPINFSELYEKANRAVVVAVSINDCWLTHYDDIGLYEVAFKLLQDKNTWIMVENTVGRLAAYDEARGSDLLLTLECILEHGSLKTVAQELFIHHNTVIWRKRKIEKFLEMYLDKMETKMLLMIYVKIWNLKKNIVE